MDNLQNNYIYQTPKPKRLRRWFFIGSIIAFTGLLVYLFGFGATGIIVRNDPTEDNKNTTKNDIAEAQKQEKENPLPNKNDGRFDVLILGIRGEKDIEDGGLLTDTMLIASIDEKTGASSLISIPRDLTINMFGIKGKINRVYETGLPNNKGLTLASEIASRISGIYVDKAVLFDFQAFANIIDQIGGIDIYLDAPFSETQQWGYEFSLPAGKNHLNSEQALYYARSRYSSSDFDRARRQQQIINAIKDKMTAGNLLSNPSNITALISSLQNHIRTNFQLWDIQNAIALAKAFGDSKTKRYVLNTDNVLFQTKSATGEYILLPKAGNFSDVKTVFKTILNGSVPTFTPLPTPTPSPSPSTKK